MSHVLKTVFCVPTKLMRMNIQQLRELGDILVVQEYGRKPIAAVLPYAEYMRIQETVINAERKIDELSTRLELMEQIADQL